MTTTGLIDDAGFSGNHVARKFLSESQRVRMGTMDPSGLERHTPLQAERLEIDVRPSRQTFWAMRMVTAFLACLGILAALLSTATPANAQTLTIGSATTSTENGGNVTIAIEFAPGARPVISYYMAFSYHSTILSGPPTVVPGAGVAMCTVDSKLQEVSLIRFNFEFTPLPAEIACIIEFPVAAGVAVGSYPFVHDPEFTGFVDSVGDVPGTVVDGGIDVIHMGPPKIVFDETPVILPDGAYASQVSGILPLSIFDGGGGPTMGAASYSCIASEGFSLTPASGGPIVNGQSLPNPTVTAMLFAEPQSGSAVCVAENAYTGPLEYVIPLFAPAGETTPPTLIADPAPGAITVPATAPGVTPGFTIDISANGGNGPNLPEYGATLTCTATGSVTVEPTSALVFPPGSPPRTIAVACLSPAGPRTGNVVCEGKDATGSIEWNYAIACPEDASLLSLSTDVGELTPAFDPDLTRYEVTVANSIDAAAFTAIAADAQASLTIGGLPLQSGVASAPVALDFGLTTVKIGVLARDGLTTRDYFVDVLRLSPEPVALALWIHPLSATAGSFHYRMTAANLGQQALAGIQLHAPMPSGFENVLWQCDAPQGCTLAAGIGDASTEFDLASGQSAMIDLIGTLLPGTRFACITAQAAEPGGVSAHVSRILPVDPIGISQGEFESRCR